MRQQWQYGKRYWRLAIHLIFKTKHFGVNNRWWVTQPSPIGWHGLQRLWAIVTVVPIWRNYQSMKVRSCLGWVPQADCEAMGFAEQIARVSKKRTDSR
ncbi:MAG: hypothetical protein RI556_00020 [Hydrogenovibrio sp.]|uniref:hypothetical protein n=1 Tax=Hydrogenovibrio TaxID=28884 RepID=UPI000365A4CB|nr:MULTISPECIES: hypothetical protein [Hydrogenovibrio]MDR9497540.1 hypothetical protein [Hydrogenovibrio sp.]